MTPMIGCRTLDALNAAWLAGCGDSRAIAEHVAVCQQCSTNRVQFDRHRRDWQAQHPEPKSWIEESIKIKLRPERTKGAN